MNCVDAALRYARVLARVQPKHGKKPLRGSRGAHDASRDPEQIRGWFAGRSDLNVAVALDDLVVIDVDAKPEGLQWLADHRRQLHNITLTCRSGGGGYHFYFKRPENVDLVGILTKGVDVLRGPGQSVLAPPSIHPVTGCQYEWIRSWPSEPQPMPPWLVSLCRRPLLVFPVNEPRDVDRETQLERARKYARRVDGAVSGSGGHRHTYTFPLKLAGNFPVLTFEDMWEILVVWNETCLPPWSQRELRHKLMDAMKRIRGGVAA